MVCLVTVSDRALIFPTPLLSQLQGWPGCQKINFFFLQINLFSFCARIEPKLSKLQKTVKIDKRSSVTELSGFNHFPCSFLMFVKCYPLLVGANPYDSPRYSGDSIKRYNASTPETLIYAQGRSDEMLYNF